MKPSFKIILLLCGILFIIVTINPLFNLFSFSRVLDKDLVISYGTLISGLFGPILSLLSIFIIYDSFREQVKNNKEQIFMQNLNNDIKYLRDYVSLITYNDPASNIILHDKMGERFFIKAKVELYKIYQVVSKNIPDEEDRIGATFEIFYIGVSENKLETLKSYLGKRANNESVEKLLKELRNKKSKFNKRIVYYDGHQGKLGHYFRQLYYIIETIDNCSLDIKKDDMIKRVIVKMGVYEQTILCYYSFAFLGKNWREKNYIDKYGLITSIPKNFLPFDPKKYFEIDFEYEKGR